MRVSFACDPERLEELSAEVFEVLESIRTDGLDQDYVDKITEIQRRNYEVGLRENGFWISQLQRRVEDDIELSGILHYDKFVDTLTPAVIQQAAQRYLNNDNYVQVSMYPGDGAAGEGEE